MKRGHNHHKNLFELKKSQLTPQHNKYMFDIPIPFCHNLYLSATFKQFLTEFDGTETVDHIVYM
jgi:hypothetical protein